jgi:hypothetical protein
VDGLSLVSDEGDEASMKEGATVKVKVKWLCRDGLSASVLAQMTSRAGGEIIGIRLSSRPPSPA